MNIRRIRARNYRPAEIQRLDLALDLLGAAINSMDFHREIVQHAPFDTPRQLSNAAIYALLMEGDEINGSEGPDFEADLDLFMDGSTSTNAVGYTLDGIIYTHRNMFQQLRASSLAGHYAHEYCHTLGFSDPRERGQLPFNVPYEVGRLVEYLAGRHDRTYISTSLTAGDITDADQLVAFKKTTVINPDLPAAKKAVRKKTSGKKAVATKAARHKPASPKKEPAALKKKRKRIK